jgi:6-hydroxytryprostatin B O-methyltransferase
LGVVTQFQIPQKLQVGSTASVKDLASSTGLPEDILARTVRYAIANGVFREPEAGVFAHSAASAALAQNSNLHAVALYSTHVITSILVKIAESLKAMQKEGAPAAPFNVAYPGYKDIFEYFRTNPDVATEYFTFLNGRAELPRWNVKHLTTAWDWAALDSKTVVDIGGSAGHSCFALALKARRAKFIIQDLSVEALKKGRERASADPDLEQRITFTKHDFFTSQPVTAHVYFLRHILHDWSDTDSVRILKALLPALKDGAKVLINEGIMPDPPIARANTLDDKEILCVILFSSVQYRVH